MKKKKVKNRKKTTLKRKDRINAGKEWIKTYSGQNFVGGYKKRFKVDILCALTELEMLGFKLDAEYVKRVIESEKARIANIKARRLRKIEEEEEEKSGLFGCDDTFSFIAGYTSGGATFGTRWDEEIEEDYMLPF